MTIGNRSLTKALLIFAAMIFLITAAECVLNLWIRSSLKAGLAGDSPQAAVRVSINWMGLKDLWLGRVDWLKIDARNCRVSGLRYNRLWLDNQGFSLNLPLFLRTKRLEITSIQKTKIFAAVSERDLRDYLNLYQSGSELGVKIANGRLQLAGNILFWGNKVPVRLEGKLVIPAAKTIGFRPLEISIAGRRVSRGLLDFISRQLPLEFSIMEHWPLKITGIGLSDGMLKLYLKELTD